MRVCPFDSCYMVRIQVGLPFHDNANPQKCIREGTKDAVSAVRPSMAEDLNESIHHRERNLVQCPFTLRMN